MSKLSCLKCCGFTISKETKLIGSRLPSLLDPNITYNILILIDEGFICQKLITSILVKLCRDSAAKSLIKLFFNRFSSLRIGFCNLTFFFLDSRTNKLCINLRGHSITFYFTYCLDLFFNERFIRWKKKKSVHRIGS